MSETQHRNRPQGDSHRNGSSSRPPQRGNKKRSRRRRNDSGGGRRFFKIFLAVVVVIGFAVVGAGLGTMFGVLNGTGMLNTSDVMPQSYTSVIYDANGTEVDKLHGEENREYVKLSMITKNLQNAVVAIEDERFYSHSGIDMRGIMRAVVENIKTFSFSQGASTITQQLIKNEVLDNEKKLERKIKEQYLAISLENSLEKQLDSKKAAKDYILELYLNTISLNHGLHGVEAASLYYFGKHASELTLAESACIAGITKNPTTYAPDTNPEKNKERQETILNKMLKLEFITQAEYDSAVTEDIYAKLVCKDSAETGEAANHNYFVEAMVDQVALDLMEKKNYTKAQAYDMIYSGGLQIHSTMDSQMQSNMEAVFMDDSMFPPSDGTYDVTYLISVMDTANPDTKTNQAHHERKTTVTNEDQVDAFVQSVKDELLDDTHTLVLDKVTTARSLQAAMVIMDHRNGEIKALVGGRGEKPGDSVFNRATQALRQQGSTMKPLASYAPAIDMGLLMPGSIIVDEPVSYGSWSPRNWNGRFLGPSSVRQGIRDSMNILAIKTYMMVGAESSFKYLESFGFTTLVEEDKAATTSLGGLTVGVSVLEQTAAYAAIANGGLYNEPRYYTEVYDHEGNVILSGADKGNHRVIKETTAYLLTDMMKDVITGGTGTQAAVSGMTIAGKTGTTNDTKDLTFYGYSPYYTAGIWMGYDTAKVMNNAGNAHMKIWKKVMTQVHSGLSNKNFTKPNGIVSLSTCGVSGDVPTDLCGNDYYGAGVRSDLAASDFKSTGEVCKAHKSFTVCSESGKIAAPTCPEDKKLSVVLAVDSSGKILNKKTEGKMDIDVNAVCEINHSATPTEPSFPNNNPPGDNNGDDGTTTSPDDTVGDTIPGEDVWDDENFGIH